MRSAKLSHIFHRPPGTFLYGNRRLFANESLGVSVFVRPSTTSMRWIPLLSSAPPTPWKPSLLGPFLRSLTLRPPFKIYFCQLSVVHPLNMPKPPQLALLSLSQEWFYWDTRHHLFISESVQPFKNLYSSNKFHFCGF